MCVCVNILLFNSSIQVCKTYSEYVLAICRVLLTVQNIIHAICMLTRNQTYTLGIHSVVLN